MTQLAPLPEFKPIDHDEIIRRWTQARAANNLLKWNALHHLFDAERRMCHITGLHDTAIDMDTLQRVAHQHALDLQPQAELEAA